MNNKATIDLVTFGDFFKAFSYGMRLEGTEAEYLALLCSTYSSTNPETRESQAKTLLAVVAVNLKIDRRVALNWPIEKFIREYRTIADQSPDVGGG
tara:strand:+ start:7389 stop:7676 length:288 start_codon:yes stop_codon:yes gene_type:complete